MAEGHGLGSSRAYEAARLRWASQADSERLAALWRAAEGTEARERAPCAGAEVMRDWLEHGGALLLEDADGRALCALRWRWNGPGWRVDPIATRPEARGEGFGRWLMTKVEALAIKRNVQSLTLSLPRTQDELVPYYQRMGYVEAGRDGEVVELRKRVGGTWQRQPGARP